MCYIYVYTASSCIVSVLHGGSQSVVALLSTNSVVIDTNRLAVLMFS